MNRRIVLFLLILMMALPAATRADVLVAAASSVRLPLETAIAGFDNPQSVRVSYAASGSLTHQILRGAPFDVFLSADQAFPARLVASGAAAEPPVVYATGEIELYAADGSDCDPDQGLAGLATPAIDSSQSVIAIANPELAPYGRAAKQALESAGAWETLARSMVFGNSVAQVAQFALTGSADCALVSRSFARSPALSRIGRSAPLPPGSHEPVVHSMLRLTDSPDSIRFFDYLRSEAVRQVFRNAGFDTPGD